MSGFPNSPRLIKGGIVLIDPETSKVIRVIALQYNPDSLTRTLQSKAVGGDDADRSAPLRLAGPPVETLKMDAEIDATDQLEVADHNAVQLGIQPQLSALEMIIYPSTGQLKAGNRLAQMGTMDIAPMESPLTLFVWSRNRIIPVRITEFTITEEAFDTNLNPIRAKVSLTLRVMNVDDFGFSHRGGSLYMSYQQNKERLSSMFNSSTLSTLGIDNLP